MRSSSLFKNMAIFRVSLYVVAMMLLLGSLFETAVEAKKRKHKSSAFQILQVTTSPSPFEIGNGELTFSAVVKVPKDLRGVDILEVTALITSPTQRSMRFLSQRLSLDANPLRQKGSRISTNLVWDGKDQAHMLVEPGTYRYELRAKLMAEKGASIRTRMVSRRSRGTVEVMRYSVPEPPSPIEIVPEPEGTPNEEILEESQEERIPEEEIGAAADEVEMLPDESTGHPLPETEGKDG